MTEKDRLLIDEYLYRNPKVARMRREYKNLNDAKLCIREMHGRGDWFSFVAYIEADTDKQHMFSRVIDWLFNSNKFFTAMTAWLKEEKK